jgi:hypothetical protein
MLATDVAIISPASIGGGQYTFNLHFSQATQAKFLRVGDYIESGVSGNRYEIVTWATFAADFTSATQVTVNFVDSDVAPPQDTGFNSSAYTPGQVDVRPAVRTEGAIGNISSFSGQSFEYQLQGGWNDLVEANKAQVGDSVVDSDGKEFYITHLEIDLFNSPFRVEEVVKEGIAPVAGTASLYRSTANIGLFQGTPISDPARTVIRNRDDFNIDLKIKELEDQITSPSGTPTVRESLENVSGSGLFALDVVSATTSGTIEKIDISDEASALAFRGVTNEVISDTQSGLVSSFGRIENVTTSFAFQDALFVAKDGTVTNIKPDIGVGGFVAGDWIIYLGHVARNQTTPANKDFFLNPTIVGQL